MSSSIFKVSHNFCFMKEIVTCPFPAPYKTPRNPSRDLKDPLSLHTKKYNRVNDVSLRRKITQV